MALRYLTLGDANIWANCSASPGKSEDHEDGPQSPSAAQGTAAHYALERMLGGNVDCETLIGTLAPNQHIIDREMIDNAERVIPEIHSMTDFLRFERKVTLVSQAGTRIFGRYDLGGGQRSTRTLRMMDYKYGFGVVEPEKNMQLLGGAMGLLQELPHDQFDFIELIVIQPRVSHPRGFVRKWTLSYDEFVRWSQWLLQRADIAIGGSDTFTPGEWCRYCKKQTNCSALRFAGLQVIDQIHGGKLDSVDAASCDYELELVKRHAKILKELERALTKQIAHRLKKGEYLPGLSAEPTFGREVWNNPEALETYERLYLIDLHKRQPITPKQAIEAGMPEALVNTLSKQPMTGYQIMRKDQIETAKEIFNGTK